MLLHLLLLILQSELASLIIKYFLINSSSECMHLDINISTSLIKFILIYCSEFHKKKKISLNRQQGADESAEEVNKHKHIHTKKKNI